MNGIYVHDGTFHKFSVHLKCSYIIIYIYICKRLKRVKRRLQIVFTEISSLEALYYELFL